VTYAVLFILAGIALLVCAGIALAMMQFARSDATFELHAPWRHGLIRSGWGRVGLAGIALGVASLGIGIFMLMEQRRRRPPPEPPPARSEVGR
jgi:hypothetical protein